MTNRLAARWFPLLAVLSLAIAALVAACAEGDDDCDCEVGFACANNADGTTACVPACGGVACATGQTCENDRCVNDGSVICDAGEHAVGAVCVPNYSGSNVCDPLRVCRRACGLSIPCADACEGDRSTTCREAAGRLAQCEASTNCTAGPYEDCCNTQFCQTFPGHPACGNVPPCQECNTECSDASCLNACIAGEPACSDCLQPFFDCRDGNGSNCDALGETCFE